MWHIITRSNKTDLIIIWSDLPRETSSCGNVYLYFISCLADMLGWIVLLLLLKSSVGTKSMTSKISDSRKANFNADEFFLRMALALGNKNPQDEICTLVSVG